MQLDSQQQHQYSVSNNTNQDAKINDPHSTSFLLYAHVHTNFINLCETDTIFQTQT